MVSAARARKLAAQVRLRRVVVLDAAELVRVVLPDVELSRTCATIRGLARVEVLFERLLRLWAVVAVDGDSRGALEV